MASSSLAKRRTPLHQRARTDAAEVVAADEISVSRREINRLAVLRLEDVVGSTRKRASAWASMDSGTCTAILVAVASKLVRTGQADVA